MSSTHGRRSLQQAELKDKAPQVSAAGSTPAKGREDYLQKKEADKAVRKVQNAIERQERTITELEAQIADWDKRLAEPEKHGIDTSDAGVFENYNELKSKLAHHMHEWEKLNYELDILQDK